MLFYMLKRFFMMIPTLFGISLLSFVLINLAPGSPLEQKIYQLRFSGASQDATTINATPITNHTGLSNEVLLALRKQYGFDKPLLLRYWIWIKNISKLSFGNSITYEEPVIDVIARKLPVSLQFGFASLFIVYFLSLPLGILKALKHNSKFDTGSSMLLIMMFSTPPMMIAILLVTFFASGQFLNWFPLGDLYSDNYDNLDFIGKVFDRCHHFVLPLVCYLIGSFTILTFFMKNSFLDAFELDFVQTARAKGLGKIKVIYHVLRNAMIPILAGLGGYLSFFLAGSLVIEQIFNLDGLGLLGYNSVLSRDYNVLMALVIIQSVIVLLGRFVSDIAYTMVDPRIDFS